MNRQALLQLLHEAGEKRTDSFELIPLHSHASYRSYYRVRCHTGNSYVVMEIPPGQWSVSEEISNANLKSDELPFLNIARYLTSKGFPVPTIMGSKPEHGLLLLEDIGDTSLEQLLHQAAPQDWARYYQCAINLLVDMQNKTNLKDQDCVAGRRCFDHRLLTWELEHFFEYGIERRLKQKITPADRAVFADYSTKIVQTLKEAPQVFVHRDFQSRNLMWHEDKLWLIDFQDALSGPFTYDLVALLRDSYIELTAQQVTELIDYFLERQRETYDNSFHAAQFKKIFDLTTVQRKLKDAGRFVFIDQEKANSNFLQYIPSSLQYVRDALERQAELKEFYDCLQHYVPEWN